MKGRLVVIPVFLSLSIVLCSAAVSAGGDGSATSQNRIVLSLSSGNPYPPDDSDPDGDGIPNKYELAYGTDPGKKTLFVRPRKKAGTGGTWVFWDEFSDVYLPLLKVYTGTGEGQLGIEIVCIGPWKTGGTHHLNYDKLLDIGYNPMTDLKGPTGTGQDLAGPQHIDILDIYYNAPKAIVTSTANKGHTFFHPTYRFWCWDIPAYATSTTSYGSNGYLTAYLYPFSIDNYFTEGHYNSIALNAAKQITGNTCNGIVCEKQASPFNHDKLNETPPSGVEINQVVFASNGTVTAEPVFGESQWSKVQVVLRTLAHEMGHALLGSLNPGNDHCTDKLCIMYPYIALANQWTLTDFHCPVHSVDYMRSKVHNKAGPN